MEFIFQRKTRLIIKLPELMLNLLKLFRYKTLLTLAFMLLVFHFGFLKFQDLQLALKDWEFLLFTFATLCVFGAGFLMYEIIDHENSNRFEVKNSFIGTKISENSANVLYVVLTTLGVGIGFYLSNAVGKPTFGSLFIILAVINYYTVSTLEKSSILGSFLRAILPAISIVSVGMFDIIPALNEQNTILLFLLFRILFDYAIFAFLIHLMLEIIQKLERSAKIETTQSYANQNWFENPKMVVILCSLILFGCLYYIFNYLFISSLYTSILYFIIAIISPIVYISIQMLSAKTAKEMHQLALISQLLFFLGIGSIFIISLNIMHYV